MSDVYVVQWRMTGEAIVDTTSDVDALSVVASDLLLHPLPDAWLDGSIWDVTLTDIEKVEDE